MRTPLGVAKGVVDPLRRDRVLDVAGVADEHPARAVRLVEIVRQARAGEPRFALRAVHPLGELGHELEHLREVALDVLLVRRELRVRPAPDDERQAVVGRHRREPAVRTDVDLEPPVDRQTAPVAVVRGEQRRPLVVPLGPDGLGHDGVPAVGADDDLGALGHGAAVLRAAPDADDASVFDQDVLDREAFTNLRAGLARRVDEQLVQDDPPGTVGDRRVPGPRRPRDREGAEVEGVRVNRRAPVAMRRSSSPHLARAATASGCTTCVDTVSLGNVARSTTSTR